MLLLWRQPADKASTASTEHLIVVWKATGRPDACNIIHERVHGVRTSEDVAKCELGVPGREELYRYLKNKPKLASLPASWSAHTR